MPKIAIVAALEREVRPLIRNWRACEREYGGRRFRFFQQGDAVLVCGGIGAEPARRAAEAVTALFSPEIVYSVGFAGALVAELKVGAVLQPSEVVDARDASRVPAKGTDGILVTYPSLATPEHKAKLRESYAAQIVDMEAAAVARAAQVRGVEFSAVKVISDEFDFKFPLTDRFVDSAGNFLESQFAIHAALRPWIWPAVFRLAGNSSRASRALCDWLGRHLQAIGGPSPVKLVASRT